MPKTERWKTIREAPNYEVSSLGRVRRSKPGINTKKGKIRKLKIDAKGYLFVNLNVRINNKSVSIVKKVHRLVAAAFLGPIPDGYEVNHKDLNKKNNKVRNLEYLTGKQNIRHAVMHGVYGKLSLDEVEKVKQLRKQGYSLLIIALIFDIAVSTACLITKGKRWNPNENRKSANS